MTEFPVDVEEVNAMDEAVFVTAFADVAEGMPWVANGAAEGRPFATREAMISAFANAIAEGDAERQMALLQACPGLAPAETMTDQTAREQHSAGLAGLTPTEHRHLVALNAAYREKFGFPFILAMRGATKKEVIAALEGRLNNPPSAEFARALVEVQHIVRFRIEERVRP